MKYYLTSALLGVAWFGIMYLVDALDFPMLDHDVLLVHVGTCVLTALVVARLFRGPILDWDGDSWYLLPLLTITAGTAICGVLTVAALEFTRPPGVSMDLEAWYGYPIYFVLFSVTLFLPLTYPAAFATQLILRKVAGPDDGSVSLNAQSNVSSAVAG